MPLKFRLSFLSRNTLSRKNDVGVVHGPNNLNVVTCWHLYAYDVCVCVYVRGSQRLYAYVFVRRRRELYKMTSHDATRRTKSEQKASLLQSQQAQPHKSNESGLAIEDGRELSITSIS